MRKILDGTATLKEAHGWAEALLEWSGRWDEFLPEITASEDGRARLTHERLVRTRRSLARLVNAGTPFTYLDPGLVREGPLPATNSRAERGVNAQTRAMLIIHRGLSIKRRLRAVFWWFHMHSPNPLSASEMLRTLPTDTSTKAVYERLAPLRETRRSRPSMGRCHRVVRTSSIRATPHGLGLTGHAFCPLALDGYRL